MNNKIDEVVDKALANLSVDDLKVTKEQIDEIKKRLSENKEFINKLNNPKENNKNGKFNR